MSAIAPYITTYASHTPYLTLAEWKAAPTSVDTTDLIQGGGQNQQDQVITDAIERASSLIDGFCLQVIAATKDTQYGRYRVNRWNKLVVPLPFKPILEVSSVSVGYTPSTMTALPSLVDVEINRTHVEIPLGSLTLPSTTFVGDRLLTQMVYVNGWPNTTLAADVVVAATSLTVSSALGIYPGTVLTIYDVTGGGTEQVVVSFAYVPGATTIPLTTALIYAHTKGVSISNLPPRIKEAAILLTSHLIQTRGSDAIVLGSLTSPTTMTTTQVKGAAENLELVKTMLAPYRRSA